MSTKQGTSEHQPFRLPYLSVGNPDAPDPLASGRGRSSAGLGYEERDT